MCDEAMSSAVATAVISGLVALAVAGLSAVLTWAQFQRERNKWLIDVKVAWTLELLRARLASYPTAHSVLAPLSSYADEPATAETARQVARDLTAWLYSAGGLCADAKARSAVIAVRDCCHSWGRGGGVQPAELFALRDLAINFLRLDWSWSASRPSPSTISPRLWTSCARNFAGSTFTKTADESRTPTETDPSQWATQTPLRCIRLRAIARAQPRTGRPRQR